MSIEKDVKDLQRTTSQTARNEAQVAALSTWLSMPKLVACWDMRSIDYESRIYDHSGQGRSLEQMNGFTTNSGIAPYVSLTNAQWLFRYADMGLSITGEMTVAFWIRIPVIGAGGILMGRWSTTANQRIWSFGLSAAGVLDCTISLTGAGGGGVQTIASTKALAANTWTFVAGKFIPNTELTVFNNMTKTSLLAGVFASLFAGMTKYQINGRNWGTAATIAMDIGLTGIYSNALSDASIYQLFQSSRGWYGA